MTTGPDRAGLAWRKSTYSHDNGGACVEFAPLTDGVAVRDSKNPGGGMLSLTREAWASFLADVKAGRI